MMGVKYFSLGGQDEMGRYAGVLEMNKQIYILNAGIGTRISKELGVSKVLPGLDYLFQHKDKIAGIFLGTPKSFSIGALPYFIKKLGSIPIFTTEVGNLILASLLNSVKGIGKITVMKSGEKLVVGGVEVNAVGIANSIPGSLGWVFKDGKKGSCAVFLDEFMVASENRPCKKSDLHLIKEVAGEKVDLLVIGSQGSGSTTSFASPLSDNFSFLKTTISSWVDRTVCACYEDDFHTVINLSRIADIYSLNFHILSPKFAKLFNSYLALLKSDKFVPSTELVDGPNTLVVVTGNEDDLYSEISGIISRSPSEKLGELPLSFRTKDLFLMATITSQTKEVEEIDQLNSTASLDVRVIKSPKAIMSPHAGDEDIKYVVNLLQPLFLVPVNGYYKDFVNLTIALQNTIDSQKIRFLNNGEQIEINDGKCETTQLTIVEQFIGEDGELLNISGLVVLERQLLSRGGVVSVSVGYSNRHHSFILGKCSIEGLFKEKDVRQKEAVKLVVAAVEDTLSSYIAQNSGLEMRKLKSSIKRSVNRSVDSVTRKRPAVVPIISFMDDQLNP